MMKLLSCFCLAIASLCSDVQPPEIRVHLTTASPLQPIYIGKLKAQNAAFDSGYLRELEAVLDFDLQFNGSTKVCSRSAEKEQLLDESSESWKKAGIPYAVRWQLAQKTLRIQLLPSGKTLSDISLSGDIREDRRSIHKLADAIHRALFNVDGVSHSRILFAHQSPHAGSEEAKWVSEIWECDWDGANRRQVTHENSYCISPVLLPSNQRYANDNFLYVSYKQGQPKIYIGPLSGGEGKRLVDLRGNQLLPTISLKRDKLAFVCDAAGRTDLFLQPLNPHTGELGKPVQLYSYPRSTQASPTFSPDGSKIAFVSDKDGGMRIYVIPTTLSGKRADALMITKQNKENTCPAWSPDGTKLAYSAKSSGTRQIWIYDFAAGEEWQLTSGPGNKENPSWAPNSRHLVFNSTDGASSELYIVNLNQPEAIKISRGPGKNHYPTWGAR